MSGFLSERLNRLKGELARASGELSRLPGRVPKEVVDAFQEGLASEPEIDHWHGLLQARLAARDLLTDLESTADPHDDHVPFGLSKMPFQHARLIGVEAYMATNWALADRMAGMVGRVLCIRSSFGDPKHTPNLLVHFVGDETKSRTAAMLFASIRRTFGWPIAISYALRNHFLHDGGRTARGHFFEGPDSKTAFRISEEGWRQIERTAQAYGVTSEDHRVAVWPAAPRNDLRTLLDTCEQETDDALGVLVGSAAKALIAHVGCMLGMD